MKRIPILLTLLLCHLAILGIGQNYTNNSQIFKDYSKQEPKINGANISLTELSAAHTGTFKKLFG